MKKQECLQRERKEISEEYDTPIILRTTTRLAHSQGIVNLEDRVEVEDKPYERNVAKNVMIAINVVEEDEETRKRCMHIRY